MGLFDLRRFDMVRHSRRTSVPFKEFAEKRTRKAGGRATSRTAKASTNEKRDAGKELQNKNNELTLQTTALVKRNEAIQALLEELDKQKETLGDRYPNKLYTRLRSLIESTLNDQADWVQFETYFKAPTRISWIVYASNTQI